MLDVRYQNMQYMIDAEDVELGHQKRDGTQQHNHYIKHHK